MSITIPDLVTVRARHPEAIAEAAARRTRRPLVGPTGRLMIVAADQGERLVARAGDRIDPQRRQHHTDAGQRR
ncbi:hypothetical protein AB0885_21410, partial [Streptomyces sp. NPDC005534]